MTSYLVQLTDLHIRAPGQLTYRRIDTAAYLTQAIQTVLRLPQPPHAMVITGDLTDFGRPQEYQHLKSLLAPLGTLPVYLVPGNHDDRAALRQAFPEHRYLGQDGFVQYDVRVGGLRLLALDTVIPGDSAGTLCAERLVWLDEALSQDRETPTVVAMHHPPFNTLIDAMDQLGLRSGAEALEAVIARHAQVARVVCGHLHRSIQVGFGGTVAMTCPSPAHQVRLDLGVGARSEWTLEPPAFMLHALPTAGRLISHTVACGQFEGPYPFWDAQGRLID